MYFSLQTSGCTRHTTLDSATNATGSTEYLRHHRSLLRCNLRLANCFLEILSDARYTIAMTRFKNASRRVGLLLFVANCASVILGHVTLTHCFLSCRNGLRLFWSCVCKVKNTPVCCVILNAYSSLAK